MKESLMSDNEFFTRLVNVLDALSVSVEDITDIFEGINDSLDELKSSFEYLADKIESQKL